MDLPDLPNQNLYLLSNIGIISSFFEISDDAGSQPSGAITASPITSVSICVPTPSSSLSNGFQSTIPSSSYQIPMTIKNAVSAASASTNLPKTTSVSSTSRVESSPSSSKRNEYIGIAIGVTLLVILLSLFILYVKHLYQLKSNNSEKSKPQNSGSTFDHANLELREAERPVDSEYKSELSTSFNTPRSIKAINLSKVELQGNHEPVPISNRAFELPVI